MTKPQLERLLRRLRQRVFDYYDKSPLKGEQSSRLIARCQVLLKPYREKERNDRRHHGGLTSPYQMELFRTS